MYNFKELFKEDTNISMSAEANEIYSCANILRHVYQPHQYGQVIIPMTVLRRFECSLEKTKDKVLDFVKNNPGRLGQLTKQSGYDFYNISNYNLKELLNDVDNLKDNFEDYISKFSQNVQAILTSLKLKEQIATMSENGILYNIIKHFSEIDLSPDTFDSIKMGYIFEEIVRRWYENVDQGQFYTGRDIIRLMVSLLISEGCDGLFEDGKVIKICDQACGTGGMLTTANDCLKRINPNLNIELYGQEFAKDTFGIGLSEMLVRNQDSKHFHNADSFKEDLYPEIKMDFVIENPPFGTPWKGKEAKEGQEQAVLNTYNIDAENRLENVLNGNSFKGRWGAGLPGGGDSQLLFLQSGISKLSDTGRMAIIENGSPLFNNATAGSGESNIRLWLLKSDLIESIIQLPTDLFYNTGITTYIWIISKNKREERKGKIQLIDASKICHMLRKSLGNKRYEFNIDDIEEITKLYTEFKDSDICKIYPNEYFMFKEYTIKEPMQRYYEITEESIDRLLSNDTLSNIYSETKKNAILDKLPKDRTATDIRNLETYEKNEDWFNSIINTLKENANKEKYNNPTDFLLYLMTLNLGLDNSNMNKLVKALSYQDRTSIIQKDKKGNIVYDDETKDIETVPCVDTIENYMEKEVTPYLPNAKAFWEEDLTGRTPKLKTGAEIPFTKLFYKYEEPQSPDRILEELKVDEIELQNSSYKSSLITDTVLHGLDKSVQKKDTGIKWIGSIPKHWEIIKVKNIFYRVKDECHEENPTVLSLTKEAVKIRNISTNEGQLAESYYKYTKVKIGDVLLNPMDLVTGAYSNISNYNGVISPAYFTLRLLNNELYIARYYNYLFKSLYWRKVFFSMGKGVSFDHRWTLNFETLSNLKVSVPPIEEQKQIADYLDKKIAEIDTVILQKEKEIDKLKEYKKSLIYYYVTGKKKP